MRMQSISTIGALLVISAAGIAWRPVTDAIRLEPQSRLWVSGTSTVRSFECKAGTIDADIDTVGDDPIAAVVTGTKVVETVKLIVPAASLDCGNGKMNEHMRKALKVDEHPQIVFRLATYELAKAEAGVTATLNGELTLGGVPRPVTIRADAVDAPEGTLKVSGAYEIRMTEFGLKPPTLMMGALKVNEKVNVGFELFLKE